MATYEYSMPDVNGQCGGQVQFTMNTQSPPQNTEQFQQRDSNEKPQYDGPGPLPTTLDQKICSKWRRNVLNTCNRIGDTTSRSCVEARRVCLNTNNSDTQPIPPSRVGLQPVQQRDSNEQTPEQYFLKRRITKNTLGYADAEVVKGRVTEDKELKITDGSTYSIDKQTKLNTTLRYEVTIGENIFYFEGPFQSETLAKEYQQNGYQQNITNASEASVIVQKAAEDGRLPSFPHPPPQQPSGPPPQQPSGPPPQQPSGPPPQQPSGPPPQQPSGPPPQHPSGDGETTVSREDDKADDGETKVSREDDKADDGETKVSREDDTADDGETKVSREDDKADEETAGPPSVVIISSPKYLNGKAPKAPAPAPKSVPCWEKPRGNSTKQCQKGEYLEKGSWWTRLYPPWRYSCELCIPDNISENLHKKLQQYKKKEKHSVQELEELVKALTEEIAQSGGSYEQSGGDPNDGETKETIESTEHETKEDLVSDNIKTLHNLHDRFEQDLKFAKELKSGTRERLKEMLEKVEHDLEDARGTEESKREESENQRIEVLKDIRSRISEELTKANELAATASASASAALRAAEATSAARKSAKEVAVVPKAVEDAEAVPKAVEDAEVVPKAVEDAPVPKKLSYFHNSKNTAKKQITVQRDNGLLSTGQQKQVHTMSNSFTEGHYFFESDIQDIQGRTLTSKLGVKGLVTVTPQWIGYSPKSTSDSIATFSDIDKMAKQLYNNYSTGIGEKRELMLMIKDIRSHLVTYFHKARKFEKRTLLNEIDNGQVNVYIPFGYEGSLIVFSWMRKSTSDTHYYAYPVQKWQVLETDVSFSPRNNMKRYEERMSRMPGRRGYDERDNYDRSPRRSYTDRSLDRRGYDERDNYDRSPRRSYTDRSLDRRGYEERDNYDTMRDSREYSDPRNDTPFSGDTPRMYDEMKTSREEGDDSPQSMNNYNIADMMENRLEDDLPEGHSDSEGNEELQGETKEWGVDSTDVFGTVGESKEDVGELQDLMQSDNDEAGENMEDREALEALEDLEDLEDREDLEDLEDREALEDREDREALEDREDLEDLEDLEDREDENMLFADSEDTQEEQLTEVGQEQSTVNVPKTHSDPLPNPPPLRSTDIIHRHYHYTQSLPTQNCPQPVANEQNGIMTMRDCNVEVNSGYSALDSFVTWLCEDPTKQ